VRGHVQKLSAKGKHHKRNHVEIAQDIHSPRKVESSATKDREQPVGQKKGRQKGGSPLRRGEQTQQQQNSNKVGVWDGGVLVQDFANG